MGRSEQAPPSGALSPSGPDNPVEQRPVLFVLAGPNGGGKSSLGGAFLRSRGLDYFSAEDFARQAVCSEGAPLDDAIQRGWHEGVRRLAGSVEGGRSFAIETTLGGTTMAQLVCAAYRRGFEVHLWYFGLDSEERHISRVARRASAGGFPIPDHLVRARYRSCRENLIGLLPAISHLRVFDNSPERASNSIQSPAPMLVLDLAGPVWSTPSRNNLATTPGWAKPVVEAVIQYRGLPAH